MKFHLMSIFLAVSSLTLAAAPSENVDVALVSETFGHMLVSNLKTTPLKLDIARVLKGMQDEMRGTPAPMNQENYDGAVKVLQQRIFDEVSKTNLTAAKTFMTDNGKKKGIKTIVDGQLQAEELTAGTGQVVATGSTPLIHYEGKLLDGTVFGSSYAINEPVWLPLDQAIPGFAKGIIGMKEGEKRTLYIAPEMAYGVNGTAAIPPNALLVFTVEVVKADKPKEAASP